MENDVMETISVDVADLEVQDPAYVDTMLETKEELQFENEMMGDGAKSGDATHIILYIVIGICAVAGIALGILVGRKAAYK